jgi:hypothetical protein
VVAEDAMAGTDHGGGFALDETTERLAIAIQDSRDDGPFIHGPGGGAGRRCICDRRTPG